MLLLTRRWGESIHINLGNGEEILITLVKKNSSVGVMIGIDAPKRLNIWRSELKDRQRDYKV